MSKQDKETKYHNHGQEDAAKGWGNFNPPAGVLHETINSEAAENNASYRDGYRNVC